MKNSDEIGMR